MTLTRYRKSKRKAERLCLCLERTFWSWSGRARVMPLVVPLGCLGCAQKLLRYQGSRSPLLRTALLPDALSTRVSGTTTHTGLGRPLCKSVGCDGGTVDCGFGLWAGLGWLALAFSRRQGAAGRCPCTWRGLHAASFKLRTQLTQSWLSVQSQRFA